jgi:hypothetical protein
MIINDKNRKTCKLYNFDDNSYIRDHPDIKYFKNIFDIYTKEEVITFKSESHEKKLKFI